MRLVIEWVLVTAITVPQHEINLQMIKTYDVSFFNNKLGVVIFGTLLLFKNKSLSLL